MSRSFKFSIDEFYHVYNRGTDKRAIFLDDNDRKRFYYLLFLCNGNKPFEISELILKQVFQFERGETLVDIGAVCLMDNHFHLLLHEKKENGISEFMHKVSTAYTNYFNRKYKRAGSLFEGRFKARCIDDDRYLNYLFAYIHLNPVKHNFSNDYKRYPYSSYSAFGSNIETVVSRDYILNLFEGFDNFEYWHDLKKIKYNKIIEDIEKIDN